MTSPSIRRPGMPPPLSETAADWVLRQEAGALSARDEEALSAWLAEDQAHVDAYEGAVWALDAAARHAGTAPLRKMREVALAARGERRQRRWSWAAGGAIAASFAAVALLSLQPELQQTFAGKDSVAQLEATPERSTRRTAVGERLAVTLPDGSIATLDTSSELRAAYTADERGIYLLRGQAFFEVAHGRPAPFRVYAGGQEILAVGTSFNVRLERGQVEVAVVEGTVEVRPQRSAEDDGAPRQVVMRAGDKLETGDAGPLAVRAADVAQVAAWRGGELVFNDIRLADAVAEVNRYTDRPIRVEQPAIGDLRISGVFRSNDPDRFASAVSQVLPVEAVRDSDGHRVLRAR